MERSNEEDMRNQSSEQITRSRDIARNSNISEEPEASSFSSESEEEEYGSSSSFIELDHSLDEFQGKCWGIKKFIPETFCYLSSKHPNYYSWGLAVKRINKTLNEFGFQKIHMRLTEFADYFRHIDDPLYWETHLFKFYGNKDTEDFLFILIDRESPDLRPRILKYECYIPMYAVKKEKWKKFSFKSWIENSHCVVLQEMSWNYIDCMIHCSLNEDIEPSEFHLKQLFYHKVRINGLDKSLTRIGICLPKKEFSPYYKTYIYHDTYEPEEKDVNFIQRLTSNF